MHFPWISFTGNDVDWNNIPKSHMRKWKYFSTKLTFLDDRYKYIHFPHSYFIVIYCASFTGCDWMNRFEPCSEDLRLQLAPPPPAILRDFTRFCGILQNFLNPKKSHERSTRVFCHRGGGGELLKILPRCIASVNSWTRHLKVPIICVLRLILTEFFEIPNIKEWRISLGGSYLACPFPPCVTIPSSRPPCVTIPTSGPPHVNIPTLHDHSHLTWPFPPHTLMQDDFWVCMSSSPLHHTKVTLYEHPHLTPHLLPSTWK